MDFQHLHTASVYVASREIAFMYDALEVFLSSPLSSPSHRHGGVYYSNASARQ